MAAIEALIGNLAAEDLSTRLYAILTLHDRRDEPGLAQQLAAAARNETNQALRLYLTWLADSQAGRSAPDARSVIEMLQKPEIDWVGLFYALHRIGRPAAAEILPRIRQIDAATLPENLLPMLVQFYQRHGTGEDTRLLIRWCSDRNPVVMSLAIEALARIQPECLKDMLLPLLSNQSPGIRSRAIRLLHRWYPEEAPRHLAAMLNSDQIDERRAALANAFFLPFDAIKLDILRFMIKETSPVLLLQAGNILIVNPDSEVAAVTASIAVTASNDKAPIVRQILANQVDFLVRAGIVTTGSEIEMQRLLDSARQKLHECRKQPSDPDQQARAIREKVAADPASAVVWLKKSFRIDLPDPVLIAITENLAVLEPEFLRPSLPQLLRSPSLQVQVAALSALTRISPSQAEKLLEQYVFSSSTQRRKTGFMVLSFMERAFALPLMLKTFARETDPDLLEHFSGQFPQPLESANILEMLKESLQSPEGHPAREEYFRKFCAGNGLDFSQLADRCRQNHDFILENVMVNRAAAEAIANIETRHESSGSPSATDSPSEDEVFAAKFAEKTVLQRLEQISELIEADSLSECRAEKILATEKNDFIRFYIEACLRRKELAASRQYSPVAVLQKNLARPQPDYTAIASGLIALPERSAKLAASLLQNRRWQSWKPEILPAVLAFIAKTGMASFSAPVAALLRHQQPEIRFSAIRCLELINPEELCVTIPAISEDSSPEIAALLANLAPRINAGLASALKTQAFARAAFQEIIRRHPAWQSISSTHKIAIAAAMVILFAILMKPPAEEPLPPPPARHQVPPPMQRFAGLTKTPTTGEERTVFGKVDEVRSDCLTIISPALQRKILIRYSNRPVERKNDHFNGRVKITAIGKEYIEASLLNEK